MPVFFGIYFVLPGRYRNTAILTASLLFYFVGAPGALPVLLLSIVANFFIGLALYAHRSFMLLVLGLAFNLAFLFYYKYLGFALDVVGAIIGNRASGVSHLLLPIGISFFTFQALSYLVDSFRRDIRPAWSLIDFGMYHSLFPQLIAGPIVRYAEIQHHIRDRSLDPAEVCAGLFRFLAGLGKKIILADTAGTLADTIFGLPSGELTTAVAWLGAVAYTLQIFYDFSGYSDMAIGLGRMLGFTFPENFAQPYRSRSITEFWRRWHMTLSCWFRDYLYIPLGGNKASNARTYANLFTVFVLCGLWHGAGYTFLVWGLFHGAMLCIERAAGLREGVARNPAAANAVTMVLVMIGWIVFRSETLDQARAYLGRMFFLTQAEMVYYPLAYYLRHDVMFYLAAGIALAIAPARWMPSAGFANTSGLLIRAAAGLVILLWSVVLLAANSFNPFIYFRF